jgi:transcriptional regulator with XRE-family HTH domain
LSGALGVHGELVRAKRLAEAMTQEDLANRSGLSLRLIRMAENGKSISLRSRQLLSRALSLPLSVIENKSPHAVAETVMGRRAKEFLEEIWNHANYDVIDTHLTRRFRFHHEVGIAFDRAEMKMRIQQFRQSFDHFDFEVTSTLDFGSFVVCKWHVQMTHTGTWFDVAPTGVRVAVHGASWVHVVGKQFGDAWDFWNPGLVLARLRQA